MRSLSWRCWLLICMVLTLAPHLQAQSPSTEGKDFWLGFLYNAINTTTLSLIVTGQTECTGYVENPNTGWRANFSVAPRQITNVAIPQEQAYTLASGVSNHGLHVATTDTVSIYASNFYAASFDIANVLTTSALRDEYIVQTYYNSGYSFSGFVVVATRDNTQIDIYPTARPNDRALQAPYTVTLNAGQTYHTGIWSAGTLAGTRIASRDCKPIAVFAGNGFAFVPSDVSYADHTYEQIMPLNFLGQEFVVTASALRNEDRVLITAAGDNCEIRIDGTRRATIQAYQTYELSLFEAKKTLYIETSTPAEVYLYITGEQSDESGLGDPSMVLISPIEQQMERVTFGTFQTNLTSHHFVNIVTSTAAARGMTIDGTNVASLFSPVEGNPAYSYARIEIAYGSHTLENGDGGFVAHIYGLGYRESYAYSIGANAIDLGATISIGDGGEVAQCVGHRLDMRIESDYAIASTQWKVDGQSIGSGTAASYTFGTPGYHSVMALLSFASEGCTERALDTIRATVKIADNSRHDTSITICDGSSITWHGQPYSQRGTYTATLTNAAGCDSAETLHLHLSEPPTSTVIEYVPSANLPHSYGGHIFRQASDTLLRISNDEGCDSLVHYMLVTSVTTLADSSVCESELPIVWNGVTFSEAGEERTTLTSRQGLDSLVIMRLNVRRDTRSTRRDTITENSLPVRFAGLTFSRAIADTLIVRDNAAGCDSLIRYSLHVWRNVRAEADSTVCENMLPLTWNGLSFGDAGERQATLTGCHGQDSLLTMRLHVNRNSAASRRDTVTENQLPVRFAGLSLAAAIDDTTIAMVNAAGCDSLIRYSLHVWRNLYDTLDTTVCENYMPLTWHGQTFTAARNKTLYLAGRHGEDSTVTLRLHVLRNSAYAQRDTVVENRLPVRFAGLSLAAAIDDTTIVRVNAAGCDSLIRYSLHVWRNVRAEADSTVCENSLPLRWNGLSFGDAGERQATLTGGHGQDSLLTMRLHVNRNTTYTRRDTVAENSLPVRFAGLSLAAAIDDTTIVRVNAAGCDSLIRYSLHVWRNLYDTLDTTVCQNYLPLTWHGQRFNAEGDKTLRLTARHGEDSTVLLRLHMLRNSSHTRRDTAVENSLPVRFAGLTFADSHADTLIVRVNAAGCDSLITYSLHVWHNRHTDADSAVCENYLPVQWNGITFRTGGERSATLRGAHGEDSVVAMRLQVKYNTQCLRRDTTVENQLPARFAGLSFADSHADTLIVRVNAAGCDSLITYSLHVWHNIAASRDTAVCENYLPLTWHGERFEHTDTRTLRLTAMHGEDSTVTLRLTMLRNSRSARRDSVAENSLPVWFAGLRFADRQRDTVIVRVNAAGCDSLITYSLHVWYNHRDTVDSTVCENALPLTWNGLTFSTPAMRSATLRASHGEDSIVVMRLWVLRNSRYEQHDTVIENRLPASFAGLTFFDSQADTTIIRVNAAGCDSIMTYSLLVHHNSHHRYDTMICANRMPVEWHGVAFDGPDTLNVGHIASTGADSIETLALAVGPVYDLTLNELICYVDTFYVGNRGFTDSGFYRVPLATALGCDSLIRLHLATGNLFRIDEYDTICDNRFRAFEQTDYQKPGIYTSYHEHEDDCDSIFALHLSTWPTYSDTDRVVICRDSRYMWIDSQYYDKTRAEQTIRRLSAHGCDSLRHLRLVIDQMSEALIRVSPSMVVDAGQNVTLLDITPHSAWRQWVVDGIEADTTVSVEFHYPAGRDSMQVWLRAIGPLGCADTATATLYSDITAPWAPNLFTPTSISNNRFQVSAAGVASFECFIYNRQGLLVYHSEDPSQAWDGTHHGTPCPQGAYVYVVRYSSTMQPSIQKTIKGTVTLVR